MLDEIKQFFDERLTEMERRLMAAQKRVLTLDEACELTHLSKGRMYHLCSENKIPYHKAPGTKNLKFDRKELEDWLLEGHFTPSPTKARLTQKAVNSLMTLKH